MARTEKTRRELMDLLNTKAVYSAETGLPVTFVEAITIVQRMDPEGVYCDLERVIDNHTQSEQGLEGMFAVKTDGEADNFEEICSRLGSFDRHPNAFYRNVAAVLADRDEVTITASEEDEEESLDIFTNDGYDIYAGIAVKVEDVAPADIYAQLIQKCGLEARESMLEFMATTIQADVDGEDIRLVEMFYRISNGDAWFRALSLSAEEGGPDVEELFPEALPEILEHVDWERILDSAPEPEPPVIDSGDRGKVLRPFRR